MLVLFVEWWKLRSFRSHRFVFIGLGMTIALTFATYAFCAKSYFKLKGMVEISRLIKFPILCATSYFKLIKKEWLRYLAQSKPFCKFVHVWTWPTIVNSSQQIVILNSKLDARIKVVSLPFFVIFDDNGCGCSPSCLCFDPCFTFEWHVFILFILILYLLMTKM